ncbi:hypothetical protein BGZ58_009078 [Dissophora ornata]|nr:hypothetical protein BGZ58_009078 [Dissophora ornata]
MKSSQATKTESAESGITAAPTKSVLDTSSMEAQVTPPSRRIQRGFPATSKLDSRPRTENASATTTTTSKSKVAATTASSTSTTVQDQPKDAKSEKFFLFIAAVNVAFIGRSNIGKSSLINGLVNRNGLVKTSSKPGHTRMMNFFKIGDKLSLVDMPGYGWKSRDEWGGMILEYLQNRKNLRRIYILVDPSHGLKESDMQIMKLLDSSGLSYQVILTKIDRLSKTKYGVSKAEIEAQLVKDAICCFPMVLGVSSRTKDGLDELRAAIIKAGQLSL